MHTLTADTILQQSLSNLPGLTEIRDSQGVVIGYFSPVTPERSRANAQAASHFDPEEMKRRKLSTDKGSTTSEVLNRITASEK